VSPRVAGDHRRQRALLRRLQAGRGAAQRVVASALFDLDFAYSQYQDLFAERLDAAAFARALATDRRLFAVDPSPLFNTEYYVLRNPDVTSYRYHPFEHFLTFGFYEPRSPHPLIDLPYVARAAREAGLTLARPDDLPSILGQVDPHPHFSNDYVRQRYGEDVERYATPLEYYLRAEQPRVKQASMRFSPDDYLEAHPEVAAAGRDALVDYITGGLVDQRRIAGAFIDVELVAGVLSAHGIDARPLPALIPWPHILSDYARMSGTPNPLLSGPLPNAIRMEVGVVLYRAARAEFDRLVVAMRDETGRLAVHQPDADVRIHMAVNDGRAAMYRDWLARAALPAGLIDVIDNGSNLGFGRAHNQLMAAAFGQGADHYVGLNPDGFPLRDCLENLLRLSRAVADTALIEADAFPVGHPKWFDPVSFETAWVSGAAFLLPRQLFETVGGFDERFHMYCEDVDLSWRVREAGGHTLVCPTAQFYHDVVPRFDIGDRQARTAMLTSARLLGHKWGDTGFVAHMEDVLVRDGLIRKGQMPPLPQLEPIRSSVPDFDHDLRFAISRFW
jgi:hypothetical protein